MNPVLSAQGVTLSFGQTRALRGIDLDVVRGEMLAIMGPSGSGKSSLLHVLAGVLQPDSGTVAYDGTRIDSLSETERARVRLQSFGFVFQFGQLLPDLTSVDNVSLPLLLTGVRRKEAKERALEVLATLDVADLAAKRPGEMSGGQLQRVAIARAMITRPAVLFADEPTGALDSLAAEKVMIALSALARDTSTTVVLITHDARTAAYADREIVVRDGRLSGAGR